MQTIHTPVQLIQHTDHNLLDAYSKTITGVVGSIAEAVVHIEVSKKVMDRRSRQERMTQGSGWTVSRQTSPDDGSTGTHGFSLERQSAPNPSGVSSAP
jgi:hypothetical protein